MPSIDLRKTTTATPTSQPTKDWASDSEVSEREKKMLMTTGWRQGDPVPRPLLEAIRQDLGKSDAIVQGVSGVKEVIKDIKDLSPEERAKIAEAVSSAKNARVEMTRIGGDISGLEGIIDPGIVAAMNAEELMEKKRQELNDLYKEKVKETSKDEVVASAGGEQHIRNCPNCGHDVSKTEDSSITDTDKWTFIQSVLGGKRFVKQYELFDNRLIVIFRTLTNDEADMAFTQTALDVQKNIMPDEGVYFRTLMDYRLSMSIESVKSDNGVVNVPEVLSDDFQTDLPPKGATKLCFIVPYIYENVLKTESIRRAIGSCFFRFQRMVEKMEARADDPDFWKATGRQA